MSIFGRKEKKDDGMSPLKSPKIKQRIVSPGPVSMKNMTFFFNGKSHKIDINENGTIEKMIKDFYTFGYKNGLMEGIKASTELIAFVGNDKGNYDKKKELAKDLFVKECNSKIFVIVKK